MVSNYRAGPAFTQQDYMAGIWNCYDKPGFRRLFVGICFTGSGWKSYCCICLGEASLLEFFQLDFEFVECGARVEHYSFL